jgi:hypothetical protein
MVSPAAGPVKLSNPLLCHPPIRRKVLGLLFTTFLTLADTLICDEKL